MFLTVKSDAVPSDKINDETCEYQTINPHGELLVY